MRTPHSIAVLDPREALTIKDYVRIGRYFLFLEDQIALQPGSRVKRRRERLLIERPRQIIPLIDRPVPLNGIEIQPNHPDLGHVACLVSDRDLYRAHTDNVRLFMAVPGSVNVVRLLVRYHGDILTDREVTLTENVAVETLSGLFPGRYTVLLQSGGETIAGPVEFTVAEYSLAPLSARLTYHSVDREDHSLSFELQVESYNLPFEGDIAVALVDRNRVVAETLAVCMEPGLYGGSLHMKGSGPFRLRVTAVDYPERMAEVALSGSREEERSATMISEFGTEVFFSLMPEPGALPVRGGYITTGETLATGLVVPAVVTDRPRIQAAVDVTSLVLVIADFTEKAYRVQQVGDLAAGEEVVVDLTGPVNTVFAGCLIGGRPFEGYTTFFRPSGISLSLNVPETVRPRENITISVACEGVDGGPVPVLLSVRDERLTAADTPRTALAASVKRCLDGIVAGMEDSAFTSLGPLLERKLAQSRPRPRAAHRGTILEDEDEMGVVPASAEEPLLAMASSPGPRPHRVKSREREIMAMAADPPPAADRSPEAPPAQTRSEFPEVLFYGLVPVQGEKTVTIPLRDTLGGFTVDAFVFHGGDWTHQQQRFLVDQPVRIDLDVPRAVFAGDRVTGRLRAAAGSVMADISLHRDGEPVRLRKRGPGGPILIQTERTETPAELEFDVQPGTYRATVKDMISRESDTVEVTVGTPGKIVSFAKAIHLLSPGETIDRSAPETITLRLLPTLEEPFRLLVKATAGYGHLCCEQTAAKILAAVLMYMSAEEETDRQTAEQIILAGVERQKRMFSPGKGFSMYPETHGTDVHFGPHAARHLWGLSHVGELDGLSPKLREALKTAESMADDAGAAYGMSRVPLTLNSLADAYAAVAEGTKIRKVMACIEESVDFSADPPKLTNGSGSVYERREMACAAAALLALGDVKRGLRLANPVVKQFNEEGRLYSTFDSVAAIQLMLQIRQSGILTGRGRMVANGSEMDLEKAMEMNVPLESVAGIEGVTVVEELRRVEEDWNRFGMPFPVKVEFLDDEGMEMTEFRAGDRVDMCVSLPKGYETGDLLHVCLPPSLSWIEGGGRVQQFSLDFEGYDEYCIPLVVTEDIERHQRFAVCVRNMFEEERAASPGVLSVPPKSMLGRLFGR